MSFGQGLPFDKIFEMIREQMRKAGLDLTDEQFQQALADFERFSKQLDQQFGGLPMSGIFSTRIEVGPDGTPKFSFNFGNEMQGTGPHLHMHQDGYIEPYVEVMNYDDQTLVIVEMPDALDDTVKVTKEGNALEIFAVSPAGEFRKVLDITTLKKKKLRSHSYKNGVLEIVFT